MARSVNSHPDKLFVSLLGVTPFATLLPTEEERKGTLMPITEKPLVLVSLDRSIADVTRRFEKGTDKEGQQDWGLILSPTFIKNHDTPIPGAREALNTLEERGNRILFLTSRPVTSHIATMEWLAKFGFLQPMTGAETRRLFCKPSSHRSMSKNSLEMAMPSQYIKSDAWKAGMLFTLAQAYNTLKVTVIDSWNPTLTEYLNYSKFYQTTSNPFEVVLYRTLADAITEENRVLPIPDDDSLF